MRPEGPYHLGLTGWPLDHSLSPRIHRTALRSLGLVGDYALYPIAPDRERKNGLTRLMAKLRSGSLHGLNVTIPYKVEILDHIDMLSPAAEAIGAVNTLLYRAPHILGDNTDAAGLLADLRDLFPRLFASRGDRVALVLGSGGAARAVVFGLRQIGWQVVLASRSVERGQFLASRFNQGGKEEGVSVIELSAQSLTSFTQDHAVTLLVNATPVGMAPEGDRSPWPAGVPLPNQAAVYDLVYSPQETFFVMAARQAGLQAYTGIGMLVEQAARAFEIWTGMQPSRRDLLDQLMEDST
jgi:shikimate dehydrogenase